GVYTSLHVPELDCLLDTGIVARSMASTRNILVSHGHADHLGALPALLGVRGLLGQPAPRLFVPSAIASAVETSLADLSGIQRYPLKVELVRVEPGDEHR